MACLANESLRPHVCRAWRHSEGHLAVVDCKHLYSTPFERGHFSEVRTQSDDRVTVPAADDDANANAGALLQSFADGLPN